MKNLISGVLLASTLLLSYPVYASKGGENHTENRQLVEVVFHNFHDESTGERYVVIEYRYSDGSVKFGDPTPALEV